MAIANEERVALHALSKRQRKIVETHLPLVGHTMRRHGRSVLGGRDGREPHEFFQEGCLALMEAVRSHDPSRHGAFATFAMARIRYAMSRYAHEDCGLIRVPYITQRRRKRREEDEGEVDRHRPDSMPRVIPMDSGCAGAAPMPTVRRYADKLMRRRDGETLGDLLRTRCERAMRIVVERMKVASNGGERGRHLIEACYEERWSVPEPEAQTSFRRLAAMLGCSLGRLTRTEAMFHRLLPQVLVDDAVYQQLAAQVRRHADGYRHVLSPREQAAMECGSDVEAVRR